MIEAALRRFAEKCTFQYSTGCVLWAGGKSAGRGHSAYYGSFWFDGRRWSAHRWAAFFIHGLDIDGVQVDHCCPAGAHTLCVQHLQTVTAAVNRKLQSERPGRAYQDPGVQEHWVLVQKGYREPEEILREDDGVPFFSEPEWLRKALQ